MIFCSNVHSRFGDTALSKVVWPSTKSAAGSTVPATSAEAGKRSTRLLIGSAVQRLPCLSKAIEAVKTLPEERPEFWPKGFPLLRWPHCR